MSEKKRRPEEPGNDSGQLDGQMDIDGRVHTRQCDTASKARTKRPAEMKAAGDALGLAIARIESRGRDGQEIVLVLSDGKEVTLGERVDVLDPRSVDRALIEQANHILDKLFSAKEWRPIGAGILRAATASPANPLAATFDEIVHDFEQARGYQSLVALTNADHLREVFGEADGQIPERPAFPVFRDLEKRLYVHVPSLRDFARSTHGRRVSDRWIHRTLRARGFVRPGTGDAGLSARTAQGVVKRRFSASPKGWGLDA